MSYIESIEKVQKDFMNFNKEEEWLQKRLNEGWLLIKYNDNVDEGTIYTFERVSNESQKQIVFKIDFREFDQLDEYDDYIDMFSESGWNSLSKKENGKHIFFTRSNNANKHIFSDTESFKAREKRMIQSSLRNGMIYFGFLILSILIYIRFDKAFFIGAGLFSAFAMIKSFMSYISHKKALKSIGTNRL